MTEIEVRLAIVRMLLIDVRIPPGLVVVAAIPISEWILGHDPQKPPLCTDEKE